MTAEQIKQSISLAAYVRSCGIELKAHGKNDLVGLCPFHKDAKPSFIVTPQKNLFNCPGCGKGGSVIDFVMLRESVDIKRALDILTQYNGNGSRKNVAYTAKEKKKTLTPERSTQVLEKVISFYEKIFADVPEGRQYLESRGITDAGLFSNHRIGYCNGTLTNILPEKSPIWEELKELGILFDNNRERFIGCVVVPVFDVEGNIVTLYGRYTSTNSVKNTKAHMFLPDRSKGIWNIPTIKTYPKVLVVESIIDGLSVQMAGHHNVVAISGNSSFNNGEVPLLNEHGVQHITFLLDGDDPGKEATNRLKEKIDPHLNYEVKTLPDSHDPNSYLVEYGAQKLAEFLASSPVSEIRNNTEIQNQSKITDLKSKIEPSLADGDFAVTYGLRRYEIHGLEKGLRKLKATVRIEHGGKLHVDTLDFYSARARRTLAQDICRIFEQIAETIEGDINKLLLACEHYDPEKQKTVASNPDPASQLSARERKEAEDFGKDPDLIKNILSDYEKCGLVGEKHNKLLCYLAAVSRKMDEPLSVLILSSSGAGKTALQDATLAFCPSEDVVKLTSLSGKALFYKDEFSLKHKILALEEGDGAEDASYAIRNLISAGVLVIEATIKDLLTGRLTTMENRVEGPTVVFLTTTDPNTDSETKSRFFIISVDESRLQTTSILHSQRQRRTVKGLTKDLVIESIKNKHQNFQRLLKPLAVVNPFAETLTYSDLFLQSRRDQPKYLNLIDTVAFLRQMTKPTRTVNVHNKTVPYIEVEIEDIKIANALADEILGRSLDELSMPGRDLLNHLDILAKQRAKEVKDPEDEENFPITRIEFNRRDIRSFTGWSNYRVHTHLKELVELDYVIPVSGRNGCAYRYRLAYEGQGKDGKRFMLGLKPVEKILEEVK